MLDNLRYLFSVSLVIVISMVIFVSISSAESQASSIFYISKGVKVLAFVGGPPDSLSLKPIRVTSYEDQEIYLLHKDSGPGLYSFYLKGFKYESNDEYGSFDDDGFFVVSRRKVSQTKYFPKSSLKKKSKK